MLIKDRFQLEPTPAVHLPSPTCGGVLIATRGGFNVTNGGDAFGRSTAIAHPKGSAFIRAGVFSRVSSVHGLRIAGPAAL